MNNNISAPLNPQQADVPAATGFDYNSWREKFLLTLLRISCVLGLGITLFSFIQSAQPRDWIIFPILLVTLAAVTFLRASYNLRAYILLFVTFTIGINGVLTLGTWSDATIYLLILVVLSSLLFDSFINVLTLGISFIALCILAFLEQAGLFTPSYPVPDMTVTDWAVFIVNFSLTGTLAVIAIGQLKQAFRRVIQQSQDALKSVAAERAQLENKVNERTEQLELKTFQLQASTNIARNISEIQNIPDLLKSSVTATAEQFGYYHVGIYLLDSRKKVAFLQASSSAIGEELIGFGHRVDVDTRNPISIAIERNRPYTATDIGGSVFIKDPNFPITRSRFAVPLSVRGNIIGVFDMHSDQVQILDTQDVEIIQTLADLIAISIDNVRLIDETQTLVEQLRFYNSSQTVETWSKQTNRRSPAYQYTPAGVRPIFSAAKKDDETAPGSLLIPLSLQGQKIGTIKLRRKGYSMSWSEKEKVMIEKIGEQIALALENSRLVDEAQKNAQRDQLIANISSRVRETLDVEAVIRTASTELRKVFDLKEAEISIGLPQAEPRPIRKNTSALRLK
jgi:GAF domain-containing protein